MAKQDGELLDDGSLPKLPFIRIIMKGFVGEPIATTAVFDVDKLFNHPQIVEIVQDAMVQSVKELLITAMEGNIWLLKNKPEGDR